MARARLLKPSFFVNDTLAEIPPLGRLLFQALWCLADREGRLADNPRRLKVEALPYDECDVDALLSELACRGFIVRYLANGERFIQVVKFSRHQNPHVREPASTIPAPDAAAPSYICAPGEHSASTVPEPDEHQSGPAVTPFRLLDPDPDPVTDPVRDRSTSALVNGFRGLRGWPASCDTDKTRDKVIAWLARYPTLTLADELRCMDSWLMGKPRNKASPAFVENWLKRSEVDRGEHGRGAGKTAGHQAADREVRPRRKLDRSNPYNAVVVGEYDV
jgi:hypothetical protein